MRQKKWQAWRHYYRNNWKNFLLYSLKSSSFEFSNHTYNNTIKALPVFKPFQQMGLVHLPRININPCDYLPKPRKNGELVESIQRLIRDFESPSGIIMELKRIVQSRFWNKAWLVLLSGNYGCYIIKTIFWKKKN